MASGILLASLNYGTVLPNFFGGELATFYTNAIVQPIETLLNSTAWSNGAIILLWGLFGVTVYSVFEVAIRAYEGWHEARSDIQMVSENVIVRHPLEHSFITHSLWRLGVSVVSFLFVIAVQPVVQHTFRIMHDLVTAASPGMAVRQLAFAVGAWMVILHVAIVLLRLYTLRTRLFGDRSY